MGQLNFENCGSVVYFKHLKFLLKDRIWSYSPHFGQPKQDQNCPAAIFLQKGVWSLCIWTISPFMAHPNTSHYFWVTGQRVFDWFPCPSAKKSIELVYAQFWCHWPSTSSEFEPLYPKVLRGTVKVDLLSPQKSAYPKSCPWFLVFYGQNRFSLPDLCP